MTSTEDGNRCFCMVFLPQYSALVCTGDRCRVAISGTPTAVQNHLRTDPHLSMASFEKKRIRKWAKSLAVRELSELSVPTDNMPLSVLREPEPAFKCGLCDNWFTASLNKSLFDRHHVIRHGKNVPQVKLETKVQYWCKGVFLKYWQVGDATLVEGCIVSDRLVPTDTLITSFPNIAHSRTPASLGREDSVGSTSIEDWTDLEANSLSLGSSDLSDDPSRPESESRPESGSISSSLYSDSDSSEAESSIITRDSVRTSPPRARESNAFVAEFGRHLIGIHGCEDDSPTEQDREHEYVHSGLLEYVNLLSGMPNVLPADKLLPVSSDFPDPNILRSAFTGLKNWSKIPQNVCLPCEQERTSPEGHSPAVQFDIDSVVALPSSLSCFKLGIEFSACPTYGTELGSSVHLKLRVPMLGEGTARGRLRSVPYHEVPNLRLGCAVNLPKSDIHVFFPHAYSSYTGTPVAPRRFIRLSEADKELFFDVFLDCCNKVVGGGYDQHLPLNYKSAMLASKARGQETRSKESATGRQAVYRHHFLQPEYLGEIWSMVRQTLESTAGAKHLSEPVLLLCCKNWKLLTKRPTLAGACIIFNCIWSTPTDIPATSTFVDVGREIVNMSRTNPTTYLWRECCAQAYTRWYKSVSGRKSVTLQAMKHAMLSSTATWRFKTPPNCVAGKAGLVFSQFYHSSKELFDANKTYPFTHPFLEHLGLGTHFAQSMVKATRTINPIAAAFAAFTHSKKRVHASLSQALEKGVRFGGREEHRISLDLLNQILASLGDAARAPVNLQATMQTESQDEPSPKHLPVFSIPADLYITYLYSNINKFCAAFELLRSRYGNRPPSKAATQTMVMFLRCLKVSFADNLLRDKPTLWKDSWLLPNGDLGGGLGMGSTAHTGYYWLLDKLDYTSLEFLPQHIASIGFGGMFSGVKLPRETVLALEADRDDLDRFLSLLPLSRTFPRKHEMILSALASICVKRFKADILVALSKELEFPDLVPGMSRGNYPLCYTFMTAALGHKPNIKFNPRKSLLWLIDYFWDICDERARGRWNSMPYRAVYSSVLEGLAAYDGLAVSFTRLVKQAVIATCWLLPYPNEGFFCSRDRAYWWDKQSPAPPQLPLRFKWAATTQTDVRQGQGYGETVWPGVETVPWEYLKQIFSGGHHSASLWTLAISASDILKQCPGDISILPSGANIEEITSLLAVLPQSSASNTRINPLPLPMARRRSRTQGVTQAQTSQSSIRPVVGVQAPRQSPSLSEADSPLSSPPLSSRTVPLSMPEPSSTRAVSNTEATDRPLSIRQSSTPVGSVVGPRRLPTARLPEPVVLIYPTPSARAASTRKNNHLGKVRAPPLSAGQPSAPVPSSTSRSTEVQPLRPLPKSNISNLSLTAPSSPEVLQFESLVYIKHFKALVCVSPECSHAVNSDAKTISRHFNKQSSHPTQSRELARERSTWMGKLDILPTKRLFVPKDPVGYVIPQLPVLSVASCNLCRRYLQGSGEMNKHLRAVHNAPSGQFSMVKAQRWAQSTSQGFWQYDSSLPSELPTEEQMESDNFRYTQPLGLYHK